MSQFGADEILMKSLIFPDSKCIGLVLFNVQKLLEHNEIDANEYLNGTGF